jgi:signal transduction histidine kinase
VIDLQDRLLRAERDRVLMQAAGAAAHQINQPLTVLMGTAELLTSRLKPDFEHRRSLDDMYHAAVEIRDIVQRMVAARHYATVPYVEGLEIVDFGAGQEKDA